MNNLFAPGSIDMMVSDALHREEYQNTHEALQAIARSMADAQVAYDRRIADADPHIPPPNPPSQWSRFWMG